MVTYGGAYPKEVLLALNRARQTHRLLQQTELFDAIVDSEELKSFYHEHAKLPPFVLTAMISLLDQENLPNYQKKRNAQILDCFRGETGRRFFERQIKFHGKQAPVALLEFARTFAYKHFPQELARARAIVSFGAKFPLQSSIPEDSGRELNSLLTLLWTLSPDRIKQFESATEDSKGLRKLVESKSEKILEIHGWIAALVRHRPRSDHLKYYQVVLKYGKRFDISGQFIRILVLNYYFNLDYKPRPGFEGEYLGFVCTRKVQKLLKEMPNNGEIAAKHIGLAAVAEGVPCATKFVDMFHANVRVADVLASLADILTGSNLSQPQDDEGRWAQARDEKALDMLNFEDLISTSAIHRMIVLLNQTSDRGFQEDLRRVFHLPIYQIRRIAELVFKDQTNIKERLREINCILEYPTEFIDEFLKSGNLDFMQDILKDKYGKQVYTKIIAQKDINLWASFTIHLAGESESTIKNFDLLVKKLNRYGSVGMWFKAEKAEYLRILRERGISEERFVDSGLALGSLNTGTKEKTWVNPLKEFYATEFQRLFIKSSFRKKLEFEYAEALRGNLAAAFNFVEWVRDFMDTQGPRVQEKCGDALSLVSGALSGVDAIAQGQLTAYLIKRTIPFHLMFGEELACCTLFPRPSGSHAICMIADPKSTFVELIINDKPVGRAYVLATESGPEGGTKTTFYVDSFEGGYTLLKLMEDKRVSGFMFRSLRKAAKICGFERLFIASKVTNNVPRRFVRTVEDVYWKHWVEDMPVRPLFNNDSVSEFGEERDYYFDSLPEDSTGTSSGFLFELK